MRPEPVAPGSSSAAKTLGGAKPSLGGAPGQQGGGGVGGCGINTAEEGNSQQAQGAQGDECLDQVGRGKGMGSKRVKAGELPLREKGREGQEIGGVPQAAGQAASHGGPVPAGKIGL